MKKIFLPFIILFAISAIFFLPLYFPETKAIITAEFRGGDIVNMHYPYKFFEQEKIRTGQIPFWSQYTGNGFPIFAQSEIGFFNPINTVSLLLMDVFEAMIFQIVVTFFIMLASAYYLGRMLKMQMLSSIFLATIYSFSAYSIFSIVHFPHVEALAVIPLVFAFAYQFFMRKKLRYFIFAVCAFIFQLSSGHFQNAYITILFLTVFFGGHSILAKREKLISLLKTSIALLFGVILGSFMLAPQLISTFFLIQQSPRTSDFFYLASPITLSPSYVLTLLDPFIFGNPKTGNYPFLDIVMPWDGSLFIGYLPLFFVLLFIVINRKKLFRNTLFSLLIVSFFIFFLLAWDKSSPIYFLFSIPPFSLFRINSRYLIVDVLILSIFAGFGFDYVFRKWGARKLIRTFLLLVVSIHLIFQFIFMYRWHTTISKTEFIRPPKSLAFVKDAVRIFSYGEVEKINSIFMEQGFAKDKTIYLDILKNTLATDFNLFYKIPSFNNSISGINPRRLEVLYIRLYDFLYRKSKDLGYIEKNFYYITGIDYVTSLRKLESNELTSISQYPLRSNLLVHIYKVKDSPGLVSLYTSGIQISTLDDLLKNIQEVSLKDKALIEGDMPINIRKLLITSKSTNSLKHISLERPTDEKVIINTNSSMDGLLVFRENNVPFWEAKIDGKPVQIYRAQFLSMGVWLPKGTHTVTFEYSRKFFNLGLILSALTLSFALILLTLKRVRRSL